MGLYGVQAVAIDKPNGDLTIDNLYLSLVRNVAKMTRKDIYRTMKLLKRHIKTLEVRHEEAAT